MILFMVVCLSSTAGGVFTKPKPKQRVPLEMLQKHNDEILNNFLCES